MTDLEYKSILAESRAEADDIAKQIGSLLELFEDKQIDVGFFSGGLGAYSQRLDRLCSRMQTAYDVYTFELKQELKKAR